MANDREESTPEEPKFTDKRRIDPETGEVRSEGGSASAEAPSGAPAEDTEISPEDAALLDETRASMTEELDAAKAEAAEHKDALARLQAEYVNYRNRITRDRAGDRDATARAFSDEVADAVGVIGTAEECQARIRDYADAGIHTHIITPLLADARGRDDTLAAFGREQFRF